MDQRDRSIIRQVALKCSVEIWKGVTTVEVTSDTVTLMAQEFEDWLLAPFQTASEAPQPAPNINVDTSPAMPQVAPPAGTVDVQNCPDHPGKTYDSKFEGTLRYCGWRTDELKCDWSIRIFMNEQPDGSVEKVQKWKYRGNWYTELDYTAAVGGVPVPAGDLPFE